MLDTALVAFVQLFQWPAIGYLLLGVTLGLYFGAVPGLSGIVGMAILLPFTFAMDPVSAFAFLLGMYAVTSTSDSIASILLGIPGTAASQATVLDGYPLAQQGQAARALGAAFTVSAVGGIVGAIGVALSIPILKPLILAFSSPEFFMLGVLGLTMVGSLSGSSMVKGLAAACIGVLVATVGYAVQVAIPRYWFDQIYLIDGIPMEPLVLGLFAIPELVDLAVRNTSIAKTAQGDVRHGLLAGMRDVARHWWLSLRASAIGLYIGVLPGLGGSIVDWVAYGHAVQTAKDKSRFGKGDIRGVIASEAANNAMKGGALIPTIAFGIPGSAPMAIMLGAFLIQGLSPGPQMLTTSLDVTFSLLWTLVVANVLAAAALLVLSRQLAKVVFISGHYIVPAVVLFVFMGAWMSGSNIGDWYVLLGAGIVGLIMKRAGWPRPPLVLGFILAPIMENALHISTQAYGVGWITRPICLILLLLVVLTVGTTMWRRFRERHRQSGAPRMARSGASSDAGAASRTVALPFQGLLIVAFAYALWQALEWPASVSLFPMVAGGLGLLLTSLALYFDWRELEPNRPDRATILKDVVPQWHFLGWLAAIIAGTYLVGQQVMLPLFTALYLLIWGRCGWLLTAVYTAVVWAFLYLMFGWVLNISWHPALWL